MWIIDKVVGEFDYGHNVYTQKLDETLSCSSTCKCKWLHGHRGKVVVYITANELQNEAQDMVLDFNDLKFITKFIDSTIDHKYLIAKKDPANFDTFNQIWDFKENKFMKGVLEKFENHYKVKQEVLEQLPPELYTKYESFVVLDFVPTAENLAKWIYDYANPRLTKKGVKIHKVEWYETPKSRAVYYG